MVIGRFGCLYYITIIKNFLAEGKPCRHRNGAAGFFLLANILYQLFTL